MPIYVILYNILYYKGDSIMHFNAKWITYVTGEYKTLEDKYGNPAPYFRKTFAVSKELKKAQILASAMGVYKVYLNGREVSNDYLSPGWVDYNKKLPYMRYDITNMVLNNNAVAFVLADGWASGHVGSNTTFKRNSYNDRIELCAQIKLEYADGSVEYINTDQSWRASQGEIRRSDIYMGEYTDHRMSLGDFSAVDYDDSAWDYAEETTFRFTRSIYLEEMTVPPIVVKHIFKPQLISTTSNSYLYDVSQNISGVLRCVFKGDSGATVVIRHGELIVDGKLYTENLRKAEATDTYILSGDGEEVFRPLFTFHGFRYAEITVTGNAEILDVTAEAMYSDLEKSGEFCCSCDIVNKVYSNALWSQRDNFLNVPTDCPQRDERLGWTADAQIFSRSAMYNMDCDVFYKKYLSDVRDAQLGNGVVPAVAPLPHIGFYSYVGFGPAAGWAEAIAEIPYNHYEMYGDKSVIRDNLPAIKKLLDYYESTCPDFVRQTNGYTYGDWLSLADSNKDVVSTLYYARASYVAYKLCAAIGDFEEIRYKTLYENIKEAFLKYYTDKDGKILSDTQSVYVIAYKFGITDKEFTYKNLVRKFKEDDGKLTCGFLGVRFLLPALCDVGLADIAYSLICNTDYPGWGYSVVNGATTIWEHWDSYTIENGIRTGMNSFNHYSFGSCTEWMYEYCLGIKPDFENPGFKKLLVKPYIDFSKKITKANGFYETKYGKICVLWTVNGNEATYTITCPKDIGVQFDFGELKILSQKQEGEKTIFTLIK